MADFTTFALQANTGTQGTPVWTAVGAAGSGTGVELRWSDVNNAGATTPSASWPFMTRPAVTGGVDYIYVFNADASGGLGVLGTSSATPAAFALASFNQFRWVWDNVGTFASAPIFTAYPSTAHGAITRGDGTVLGGHATDTGGTARSYLKGNAYGRVGGTMATATSATGANGPAAAPSNAPAVTDGTTGTVSPTAGANWLTNFQGLQGDTDYITAPFTPTPPTNFDSWSVVLRLFTGPNMTPGTLTWVVSNKYTYS